MDKQQARMILMERMGWTEAEFAEQERWAAENCICMECPTYVDDETALAFCWATHGMSDTISEENDCVCGQCSVFNKSRMRTAYYCTRGAELEQINEIIEEGGQEAVA